jgi:hypothetical protein
VILSCNKNNQKSNPPNSSTRLVRYELFTNEDFSGNQKIIHFRVQMMNAQKIIYDSLLAPMKIEEIPDSTHKIVVVKTVPGNDVSDLKVGFAYEIETIGMSWYYENFLSQDSFKLVSYAFQ